MPLLDFIDSISNSLIHFNTIPQQVVRKRGRPSAISQENSDSENESEPPTIRKNTYAQNARNDQARFDRDGHFPIVSDARQRCKLCQAQSTILC